MISVRRRRGEEKSAKIRGLVLEKKSPHSLSSLGGEGKKKGPCNKKSSPDERKKARDLADDDGGSNCLYYTPREITSNYPPRGARNWRGKLEDTNFHMEQLT